MNADASDPCSDVVPTKIANASCREMDRDATRMATENENTIPTFEKVRIIPDAMPNMSGGAAFMIAELLAGKNSDAPTALIAPMQTIHHSGVPLLSCAYSTSATTCRARPSVAGSTGAVLVGQAARVEADAGGEQVAGEQQQRGVDRRQAARPLQVHQQQEEHREAGEALEQRRAQRGRHRRDLEDPQRQHGRRRPATR